MHHHVRAITYGGLLVAVSIVLTRFFGVMLPIGGALALRLSFGAIPIMIGGLLFGPAVGGVIGVVADLVGVAVNPMGGAYFPGFTLSSALMGVLPPLILRGAATKELSFRRILAAVALTNLVVAVGLNTLWLVIMYGLDPWVLLPPRLAAQIIMVPIYTFVIMTVCRGYRLSHSVGYVGAGH